MSKAHRNYFNKIAPQWNDRMQDDPVFLEYLTRFGVSRGNRVLDVGAGTGRMTKHIFHLVGREGLAVAEDIADQMLCEGKNILSNTHLCWVCDDILQLAFKNDSFDKVLCFSTFPHFQNPLAALKEMRRVLRPGGKLLILHTFSSDELNTFHAQLETPVCHDRLSRAEAVIPILNQAGLKPLKTIENENLYWVEAVK